jgi:DNA polymerase-3 subunit delta
MMRNLDDILYDLSKGRGPSWLLLYGDDYEVREARKALVDRLVPENLRGFNLERFDGRYVPWDQIQGSLMTPPFLPGKKVVWVENASYFIAREQKGESGQRVLQLWTEGKKEEAGKLLLDSLVAGGCTEEQWHQWKAGSSLARLIGLLGIGEPEGKETVAEIMDYCRSQDMNLSRHRGPEAHGLAELLEGGLPPWDFVLLTASQVDRRTRLYKKFEEKGVVLQFGFERERNGKPNREKLAEFIDRHIVLAGKKVEPRARDLILLRAGDELGILRQELEKLLLYVGDRPTIGVQEVAVSVGDQGAAWIFDLTRAVASRNAVAALCELGRLIAQGEHPLKLLATLASEVRKLLSARQLIDGELRGRWKRGMSYAQFQQGVLKEGTTLLTRNPYADYMCFQRADHFSLAELASHLHHIHDTDLQLKSSGSQPRLVMERLILTMCLRPRKDVTSTNQVASR